MSDFLSKLKPNEPNKRDETIMYALHERPLEIIIALIEDVHLMFKCTNEYDLQADADVL